MQRVGDVLDRGTPAGEFAAGSPCGRARRSSRRSFSCFSSSSNCGASIARSSALRVTNGRWASAARNTIALRAAPQTTGQPKWRSMDLQVRPRLHELHAKRRAGAYRYHGEQWRAPRRSSNRSEPAARFLGEKPAELDAPLFVVVLLQDLFRAGELFVARHWSMAAPKFSVERAARPTGWNRSIFVSVPELEADRRVGADFANGAPKGKQFLGVEQYARLIDQALAEARPCAGPRRHGLPVLPTCEVLPETRKCLFIVYSDLREAMSMEKRYFTSDLSSLS